MTWLRLLIETMRPKQWTKNAFVFAGLVFSLKFFHDPAAVLRTVLAAAIFSAVSGCVYIVNDIIDYDRDRAHPEKRGRPIASGRLGRRAAAAAGVVVLAAAFWGAWTLDAELAGVCLLYFVMNLLYSLYLKQQVILDVLLIAVGFVLRAFAGTVVIDVEISEWLLLCTLLLALFLALCKRRHELVVVEGKAGRTRVVLKEYTPELLDQMIAVVTASTLMAYSLYTISPRVQDVFHTTNLMYTIPFVLYGIFRYLYLVHQKNLGGSPELILLRDRPMIIDLALWGLAVVLILYTR